MDANRVILPSLIDSWNRRLRDGKTLDGENGGNPDVLTYQLEAIFEPIFSEVQRSQAHAHSIAEILCHQEFDLSHYGDQSDSEQR